MIPDNPQNSTVVKLERKRLRADLVRNEEGKEDFFSFQARCVKKFGAVAGICVRQLVFWAGKGMDPEGWIYKSEEEWELETGLGRRGLREARKVLTGCEVLEEKRQGLPCRLFYRVNLETLTEVLETPGSTLNQWKVGRKKDPETGAFYRPEQPTLNHDSRQVGISDLTSEVGIIDLAGEDGNRDLASEVGISDLTSEDGNRDLAGEVGNTDPAITETTSREDLRRVTAQNTSEKTSREFPFQGAASAQNRAAPPHQINKSNQSKEEEDPTTPASPQHNVDKLAKEVRRLMEDGRHAPVALKHYRAGRMNVEDVALYVSQDATGSEKLAETLLPAVRLVLEESAEVAS